MDIEQIQVQAEVDIDGLYLQTEVDIDQIYLLADAADWAEEGYHSTLSKYV